MSQQSIQFGWGAPSFAKQLPQLSAPDAERADSISKAITLLSIHGVITEAERDKAIKRATRGIEAALRKVILAADRAPATEGC